MEFSLRPYTESDAAPCGECLYEGFFTGPIDENDRRFLREYAQVLIEKCNFTYVAETEAGQVVGFVCGKYSKPFSPALANRYETKKHYGLWCRMFFQFYLKRYPMSPSFQRQFGAFYQQMRERRQDVFGACDLELVALSSKAAYRKGLGTALVTAFLNRAAADGAGSVRLFTNSLASWEFYEKRGFTRVAEYPFRGGSGHRSMVYAYQVGEELHETGG
ncbi:MAG: GNAT family N-acetyltransferase [Evtepia sp.]